MLAQINRVAFELVGIPIYWLCIELSYQESLLPCGSAAEKLFG